jgi:hypothetical protein
MAWIKMRTDLPTDPRVVTMATALQVPMAQVVGSCFVLWSIADTHTTDGVVRMTEQSIDAVVGLPGFTGAMVEADWLEPVAGGFGIPRWDKHLSQTAKQRAQSAQRMSKHRGYADSVTEAQPDRNDSAPRVRARGRARSALPLAHSTHDSSSVNSEHSTAPRAREDATTNGSEVPDATKRRGAPDLSGWEGACSAARLLRAFELVYESPVSARSRGKLLHAVTDIAKHRDPVPDVARIIESSGTAKNPGGYISRAIRSEAADLADRT